MFEPVAPGVGRLGILFVNVFALGEPGGLWLLVDAGLAGSAGLIRRAVARCFGVGARPLLLGYLMYRSGLVPRRMAILGLIAGPVLLVRFVGILFGLFEPGSVLGSIMVAPEFVWELSLGIWLIVKGFNPSALASLSTDPDDGVLTGVDQPTAVPSNGHVTAKG